MNAVSNIPFDVHPMARDAAIARVPKKVAEFGRFITEVPD
jgi:hypothetical protein